MTPLIDRLAFINRNPFRRADLIYSPGEKAHTTDLVLTIEERRPYRFYAGTDNTGVVTTDQNRVFSGVDGTYLLGCEQMLSFQYTSAYAWRRFQGFTLQYKVFFPVGHVLDLYGGYIFVNARMPFSSISHKHHGESGQASMRYTIPLQGGRLYSHEITVGFDYKSTNNSLDVESLALIGREVNLTQLMAQYALEFKNGTSKIKFMQEIFWSPGPILPNQTNADFASLRPGAHNHWVYGRTSFSYLQTLRKEYSLWFLLRGQLSSQNLLPSEEAAIGGYNTVRGYDERQLNKDSALLLNAEWRTPPISLIKQIRKTNIRDALQFLLFFDSGIGTNHTRFPNEPKVEYLMGAGPGLRYTLDPYLSLRLDWGVKLHQKVFFEGARSKLHFSAVVSY